MDARDATKMTGVLTEIRRSLDAMHKVGERTAKALERMGTTQENERKKRLFPAPMLEDAVPVNIDWETPMAVGTAQIYKHTDGTTKIEIAIDSKDTERIDTLIYGGFVDILRLSVMEN